MKFNRPFINALVAVAVALFFAMPVAAKDKWINLRTKNFNVVSNASEDDTRKVARKLEQFCAVTSTLFKIQSASPVPVTVVVFKNDGSFKPFKPLYNGKPANVTGYFQRGDDENMIALNIVGDDEHPLSVIFHEYTHLLTAYTSRQMPPWMAEGFAELYSTFEVEKNSVKIGMPVSSHVFMLRENRFLPLKSLFQVTQDSPDYNERNKQGIFYAESWALIHYLMLGNNGARRQQLSEFLKRFDSGADIEQAFTEAFNTDTASMEKELRKYVGNDSYQGRLYNLNDTEGEREMTIKALADAEVQFYLGNLLLHTDRPDEAEAYFKQATTLDANLCGPYEGMGVLAMRRNKYSEAKEHLKQALARGSQNHLTHYYYAETLERELSGGTRNLSVIQPEMAKVMIEELKTSIKLMPGFAPAYNLLGFIYLVTGENMKEAEQLMKTALRVEPQSKQLALTFAQIQVRMQNYDAAKKTLAPLLDSTDDPQAKQMAESLMANIDAYTRRPASNNDGRSSEADSKSPHLKGALGKSSTSDSGRGPMLKLEGAEIMNGVLAAIECEGGMVLVFKSGDKLLRFGVGDVVNLQFYTHDPQFTPQMGCGPINLPAYIHFKPPSGSLAKFAGDVIAVEFK